MKMQTKGPAAGWSWLMFGIKAGFKHPKPLFGASALLLVFGVLIGGLQMLTQYGFTQSPHMQLMLMGLFMLIGAAVYPMLWGGFMRVLDAARNARPVRAMQLFDPFKPGQGGSRLVMLGICFMLVYVLFLAALYFTIGHAIGTWYMKTMAAGFHPGKPVAMPSLPSGFGATFSLLMVFFMFYSAAFAIAIGQTAMGAQPPLVALRQGLAGAFKNVLPLLVLSISSFVALIVFGLALAILVALVTVMASLISTWVAMILMTAIYLTMMLYMYVVMFGVMYAMWQDVSAGPSPGLEDTATMVEA